MVKQYRFLSFLSDTKEYREAETFWKKVINKILADNGMIADWDEWFKNTYANGTPVLDGNPIVSMISRKQNSGIRVIQYDPHDSGATDDDVEFEAWVDYFGKSDSDKGIRNLVISCAVTEDTERLASLILHGFVVERLSDNDMELLAGKLMGRSDR